METTDLLKKIEKTLEGSKKVASLVIDVTKKSEFLQYIVLSSAASPKEARELLLKVLEAVPVEPLNIEGIEKAEWIVADYGKILLHIFLPEAREKYNLEKLWTVGDNVHEIKTAPKQKVKK